MQKAKLDLMLNSGAKHIFEEDMERKVSPPAKDPDAEPVKAVSPIP